MAGQKFEYDESGSTFLYFLISFLGLVLVPCTFYFWPADVVVVDDPEKKAGCRCDGCIRKEIRQKKPEKWKGMKKNIQRTVIVLGWCFMAFLVYRVQEFDYEYANFDPYDILGVGTQSSQADIKKSYKKLALIYHPDKPTGDERKFVKLNKAYQALTDDTARRNYELYGNPDGPGTMHFGIALPSWIVEKENSLWVLGLYGLVFMIGLPTVVAIWWYRSSKFSNDQVLLDTNQLYYYFFHKTPQMVFKRALTMLAASLEFEKGHNPVIQERPSDNVEVPSLIKRLPNLGEKNKERPLCYPYSIKTRAILHAHLSRMSLNENSLELDRLYIVNLCPMLINEMVTCVSQLIFLAHAGRISRLPSLDTIEATMRLSPCIVQALWEGKSPMLQLPHITEESIRHFVCKKKSIRSINQLISLQSDDRRQVLKALPDDQYNNVMKVCAYMPNIDMSVNYEVVDDEDEGVFTAGAIVTVTVHLYRRPLEEFFEGRHIDLSAQDNNMVGEEAPEKEKTVKTANDKTSNSSGWRNPQAKKGGSKGNASSNGKKKHENKKNRGNKKIEEVKDNKKEEKDNIKEEKDKKEDKKPGDKKEEKKKEDRREGKVDPKERKESKEDRREGKGNTKERKEKTVKNDRLEDIYESDDENSSSHSDESEAEEADTESHKEKTDEDEDAEWEKFQKGLTKREKVLEGKSLISHPVHSPYFPDDKQEFWWTYVCDKKKHMLITAPFHITNLVREEEVQLKFTAPHKPGLYIFQVCLKSDSYIGMDQSVDIKLDVKEAREIPVAHPQWEEFSSNEDENSDQEQENDYGESDYTTDEDLATDSSG